MWLIFYCDFFFDTIEDAFKQVRVDFGENHHVLSRVDKRQYDPIAVEYRLVEETPIQKHIYDPAISNFIKKEAIGKTVVVLHGASGYRARLAKHSGAGKVIGVDMSYRQIQVARAEELRDPLGIDYLILDPYSRDFLSSIPSELVGNVDVVLGAFLLDHSMTYEELQLVLQNIYILLKAGGIFFGLSDNPNATMPTNTKYGVVISLENPKDTIENADVRRISIYQNILGSDKEVLHFHNFLWMKNTVISAMKDSGFDSIVFDVAAVSERGVEKYGKDFWEAYNENPTTCVLRAQKITLDCLL
jgi:SAM-dependent methyltransferase